MTMIDFSFLVLRHYEPTLFFLSLLMIALFLGSSQVLHSLAIGFIIRSLRAKKVIV